LGIPISVHPRHVYRSGGLALLIVDWSITGAAADGRAVDFRGTPPTSRAGAPMATGGTPSTTLGAQCSPSLRCR